MYYSKGYLGYIILGIGIAVVSAIIASKLGFMKIEFNEEALRKNNITVTPIDNSDAGFSEEA